MPLVPPDFRPTAALNVLKARAIALKAVRRFFDERGYLEVETPVLSQETVVDAWVEPIPVTTALESGSSSREVAPSHYLQTSPELCMKRLLAAGLTAIYQIAHAFRRGEVGAHHNPEFTMVEWYRVGETHQQQMMVTEELVRAVVTAVQSKFEATGGSEMPQTVDQSAEDNLPSRKALNDEPFACMTWDAAFREHLGVSVIEKPLQELRALAAERNIHLPADIDREGAHNWLFAECIEDNLGDAQPVFLVDYPASQAALAKVRAGSVPVAERFELFWQGRELCNGYHELTSAAELRRRIEQQNATRRQNQRPALPAPQRLLAAMDAGLPECAGVALGFDRLLQQTLNLPTLHDVIAFPFDRA